MAYTRQKPHNMMIDELAYSMLSCVDSLDERNEIDESLLQYFRDLKDQVPNAEPKEPENLSRIGKKAFFGMIESIREGVERFYSNSNGQQNRRSKGNSLTPVDPGQPRSTPVDPGQPRSTPVNPGQSPVDPGRPRSTPVDPGRPNKQTNKRTIKGRKKRRKEHNNKQNRVRLFQ